MNRGKICVIEDDEIILKVIVAELSDVGFDVSYATDGESGMALIESKNPDLVILDILLPKKNGLGVLEDLKSTPSLKNIPVILLTALGGDEDIKRGLSLGATDYIVKSEHTMNEIMEKIENFFRKSQHPQVIKNY